MSSPVPVSNMDLAETPKETKTIFEILEKETIVFGNDVIDTVITINSTGYCWWFRNTDGTFTLTDVLYASYDLKRVDIDFARREAENWFKHALGEFVEDESEGTAVSDRIAEENANSGVYRNPQKKSEVNELPLVEPRFIDQDKKDAHTEHCCAEHSRCMYNNKKCSVVIGRKKPSYPCRCHMAS